MPTSHLGTSKFFLTLPAFLAGFALVALSACDPKGSDDVLAANPPAKAAVLPTAEHALERARARWDHISKQEWVEAYEFQTPEIKRKMDLAHFLSGKSHHSYDNPKVEGVLKLEKNFVLLRSTVMWTPHNPELQRVKLEPGQTVTQAVPMIETWKWEAGDWYFVVQQGTDEFFKKHPEMLKEGEDVDGHAVAPKAGDPSTKVPLKTSADTAPAQTDKPAPK